MLGVPACPVVSLLTLSPRPTDIHHQGGGWCESLDDCLGRSNSTLGSSKGYPTTAALGGGYFSTDPAVNPLMCEVPNVCPPPPTTAPAGCNLMAFQLCVSMLPRGIRSLRLHPSPVSPSPRLSVSPSLRLSVSRSPRPPAPRPPASHVHIYAVPTRCRYAPAHPGQLGRFSPATWCSPLQLSIHSPAGASLGSAVGLLDALYLWS